MAKRGRRKHYVTCVHCGKQFDANSGFSYDRFSRRYTCPSCDFAIRIERRKKEGNPPDPFRTYSQWMLIISSISILVLFSQENTPYFPIQLSEKVVFLIAALLGASKKAGRKAHIVEGWAYIVAAVISLLVSLSRKNPVSVSISLYLAGALLNLIKLRKEQKVSEESENSAESSKPIVKITNRTNNLETHYDDELFPVAVDIILETGQATASMLQRRLKLAYSRAARLIDNMERMGIVSSFDGSSLRSILITKEQWVQMRDHIHYALPESSHIKINTDQIIRDEENWRREQRGLSPIEYELERIDGMEGHAFEEWCADLLRRNGFSSVNVTPGSGDQGVDVTAEKDGLKYAVQCKRYSSDLGNTPIQEVVAGKAFYRCHVGAVMTNRYFTSSAKELAEVNGILLWDRGVIASMLKVENSSNGNV